MATPHVAGVAGLVWAATDSSEVNLCTTNECVRDRIEAGADKIPGLAVYWTEGQRLNANGAVNLPPPSGP
jgi:subtilisin family serine protease